MKNRSLLFAFALTIGLFATSCSDDDNDGETLLSVIGKWNLTQVGIVIAGEEILVDAPQNEAGCAKDYLELKISDEAVLGDYDSTDSPCTLTNATGVYVRSHNNLTTVIGDVTKVQDIVNLTVTELKLRDENGIIEVYERD
jgi:hypothetical protein